MSVPYSVVPHFNFPYIPFLVVNTASSMLTSSLHIILEITRTLLKQSFSLLRNCFQSVNFRSEVRVA